MLLTMLYSESAFPITPVEPLKAILYDYFANTQTNINRVLIILYIKTQ